MTVPTRPLVHGASIPVIGIGTWPLSNREVHRTLLDAFALGYRLIDTAFAYGNEAGVGRAIADSGIDRSEFFVTSKFNADMHGIKESQAALDRALKKMGLSYLDLYLIHWPNPRLNRYVDAWRGLIRALEDGRVRAIGTSNFKAAHIDRLLDETGVVPDLNQIELNPYRSRPAMREYDDAHGIVTQSWAPLDKASDLLAEPIVRDLANSYGRTPAQIVLRWHLDNDVVTIPKSSSPQRLAENIDLFDFELSSTELTLLEELDQGDGGAVDSDHVGH